MRRRFRADFRCKGTYRVVEAVASWEARLEVSRPPVSSYLPSSRLTTFTFVPIGFGSTHCRPRGWTEERLGASVLQQPTMRVSGSTERHGARNSPGNYTVPYDVSKSCHTSQYYVSACLRVSVRAEASTLF